MKYLVDFGPNTDSETFDTMDEIESWLDQYIIDHLQYNEDFDTAKKAFIDIQITAIYDDE